MECKPSRGYFLEQTQSKRLGVEVRECNEAATRQEGAPRGVGVPPTLVGPL